MFLRRSRFALIVAVVIVFVLYRTFQNSGIDPAAHTLAPKPNTIRPSTQDPTDGRNVSEEPSEIEEYENPIPDLKQNEESADFTLPTKPKTGDDANVPKKEDMLVAVSVVTRKFEAEPTTTPASKQTAKPDSAKGLEDEEIRAKNPPGRMPDTSLSADLAAAPEQIHWKKQPEHFPVPKESIIPLPTGTPKKFPKIQYDFKAESPSDKEIRLKRLELVKAEATRSWNGYRKYAWKHDELQPLSLSHRDPFCGWAATLVDSLDTLWIMGLKEEFDEAVKATSEIDFTFSPRRNDIPVFETIIRYLGGLLAAYDVSGGHEGKHRVLLDKAVELAEILMGVFDTPNRMPILYYMWMPEYASQPHRATSGSVAEIASMSMEFTRLAQLTGEDKYYDAIARITNALNDLQDRGTSIPGIFPEHLDISGCNKTATRELALSRQAEEQVKAEAEKQAKEQTTEQVQDQGREETPEAPEDHESVQIGDPQKPARPDEEEALPRGKSFEPASGPNSISRRAVMVGEDGQVETGISDAESIPQMGELEFPTMPGPHHDRPPYGADGSHADFECVPQGIKPAYGYHQYSMGGSQDSAYEYFPKEDLLLGGLESVYKTLHINTVEAVKKWLLYRPMIPNDRNVLFSSKVISSGDPAKDARYEYEVTHLTCFLGGMFGLGGRMYDRPEDVEIGKKLTDGCVWAYESMPTGIMPEGATIVPCAEQESCPFNETLWWEHLDPQGWYRTKNINEWETRQVKKQQEREDMIKAQQEELRRAEVAGIPSKDGDGTTQSKEMFNDDAPADGASKNEEDSAGRINERDIPSAEGSTPDMLKDKLDLNQPATGGQTVSGGVLGQIPIKDDAVLEVPDPKPLSHEEYVKQKLEKEGIPPGFVSINHRQYILRPEAIESVWYMYRITGDPIWQEKGWRMFEAIVKATRTDVGNSAIDNVLSDNPTQNDTMESFWLAETLKYFYLLFSEPDVISLDDWVLNTEAHPFKRPA